MVALFEQFLLKLMHLRGLESHAVRTSFGDQHVIKGRLKGERAPVVLIHGLSSCAVHYYNLVRHMQSGTRGIIMPDLPGHGSSAPMSPEKRQNELQGIVNKTLDDVIDEPSVIFGTSLGGFVAIRYALANPGNVKALVLSSPGGAAMEPLDLYLFLNTFRIDSYRQALGFLELLFNRRHISHHLLALPIMRRFRDPGLRAQLNRLRASDLLKPQELRSLRVPTLLIWGKADRILPRRCFDFFARHLPRTARIVEPDDFGHAPFIQHPELLSQYVLDFIDELEDNSMVRAEAG